MRSRLLRPVFLMIVLFAVMTAHGQARSEEALTDGGGTPDVLESIFIPALPNAPFSLQLNTEWARITSGGATYTVVNSRPIKRDSAGRIYQERWLLTPKGSGIPSSMNWIQIADPTTGTLLQCSPRQQMCEMVKWNMPSMARFTPPAPISAPLRDGKGYFVLEDLGTGDVLGSPVHQYRQTVTYNPGALGNDKAMSFTREFSYSAGLGINLSSVLDSPHVGRQQFMVRELSTSEPEAKWFKAPEGYRVLDHRSVPQQPGQQ